MCLNVCGGVSHLSHAVLYHQSEANAAKHLILNLNVKIFRRHCDNGTQTLVQHFFSASLTLLQLSGFVDTDAIQDI